MKVRFLYKRSLSLTTGERKKHRETRASDTNSRNRRKKYRVLVPVPDADLEGVGLAIGERGESIDPPLSEPRRSLHPVRALVHPRRRCRDRCGDLIDTVEDPQQVLRLSQFRLLFFHDSFSSSTPRAGADRSGVTSLLRYSNQNLEIAKKGQGNVESIKESSTHPSTNPARKAHKQSLLRHLFYAEWRDRESKGASFIGLGHVPSLKLQPSLFINKWRR